MKTVSNTRSAVNFFTRLFVTICLFQSGIPRSASGQQIDWLVYDTVLYNFNPAFSSLPAVRGNANELICSWLGQYVLSYDQAIYGTHVIRYFSPTGAPGFSNTLGPKATIRNISVRGNRDIIVSGSFLDTLLVNGIQLFTVNQPGQYVRNVFLVCFSSSGNYLWSRNVSFTQPGLEVLDADAVDQNGNYWFANMGFTGGSPSAVCLSATGQDSLVFPLPSGSILLSDMAFDASGSMYLAGGTGSGNLLFGGLTVSITSTYNRFLAKMDQSGQGKWFYTAGDITIQKHRIAPDDSAHIYFTGELYDSLTIGGFHLNGPDWVSDFLTVKFDSSGNVLWANDVPNGPTVTGDLRLALGNPIDADNAGYYQLVSYRGLVDFGNGSVVGAFPPLNNYGASLLRFDPQGNLQWHIDIPTITGIYPYTVTSDSGGGFIVGTASGSQQIGTDSIVVPSNYTFLSWAAEFSAAATAGISAFSSTTGATLFPNPSTDGRLTMHEPSRSGSLCIFESTGKLLREYTTLQGVNRFDTGLPSGIYLVGSPDSGMFRWVVLR